MLLRLGSVLTYLFSPEGPGWSARLYLSTNVAMVYGRLLGFLKFWIWVGMAIATGLLLGRLT